MKTIIQGVIAATAIATTGPIFGATNLNFNTVSATSERAIRLSWNSTTNEVYEIDYADQLVDISQGGPNWQPLYTEYASHGTNTFVTDAGNYDISPEIPHPTLSPMRFYRIALVGTNTSPTNPTVAITFPTNGASLSGDVTVVVSSSSPEILTELKFYIDGEGQWSSADGTNFIVNTCEWPNGPHVLFVAAKSLSGLEGVPNGGDITYGRSVSSYVNVTFNNLITSFDLSERFFEPALGQTQKVTATFTANVNWTLEIQNAATNDVRYVTGSGGTMEFDWDGTGTNGATIPDGAYSYLLTVLTNGQSLPNHSGGGGNTNPPPSPGAAFAGPSGSLSDGGTLEIQYPPLPPGLFYGLDKNGNPITNRTEIIQWPASSLDGASGVSADSSSFATASSGFAAASFASNTQSTRAPERKPRAGVKNYVGTFGILYKTYGSNGFSAQHPLTGWPFPLPTRVAIDGQSSTAQTVDKPLNEASKIAKDFTEYMKRAAWKAAFVKPNDQWGSTDIKKASLGGNSLFNTVNFGLLMSHGSYATTSESDSVTYTYLWLLTMTNQASEYVQLSDMDFGSSGTNGLRWMTIYACNTLRSANYDSMNSAGKIPVNDNLHLLLAPSTIAYFCDQLGAFYGNNLTVNNKTIIDSFNQAGALAHGQDHFGVTNVVKFAVSGWPACFTDKLGNYTDPDTINGLQYQETTVFTP